MFGLTPAHLVLILAIALIVVGPGKLPEVGAAMGKTIREFQKASSPIQEALAPAAAPAAPQAQVQPVAPPVYADAPSYPAPVQQPGMGDFSPIVHSPLPPASSTAATAVVEEPAAASLVG